MWALSSGETLTLSWFVCACGTGQGERCRFQDWPRGVCQVRSAKSRGGPDLLWQARGRGEQADRQGYALLCFALDEALSLQVPALAANALLATTLHRLLRSCCAFPPKGKAFVVTWLIAVAPILVHRQLVGLLGRLVV